MHREINLLPPELQKNLGEGVIDSIRRMITIFMFIGTALGFVFFLVFWWYSAKALNIAQYEINKLTPQMEQVIKIETENKSLQDGLTDLGKIREERINWNNVLIDMNNRLPRDTWITGFYFGKDAKISIRGLTVNVSQIGTFIYELNQLPYYEDLSLVRVSEVKVGDTSVNEFNLVGKLVKGSD